MRRGSVRMLAAVALATALVSCGRPQEPTRFLNFDAESTVGVLVSGWSGFEKTSEGDTFVWSQARQAKLTVVDRGDGDRILRFRCWPFRFPGAGPQTATVFVNGAKIESLVLSDGSRVYTLVTPKAVWKEGPNEVRFDFAYAESPKDRIPGSIDARTLSAAFDWLEILPPLPAPEKR